jgi:hypothetical protein
MTEEEFMTIENMRHYDIDNNRDERRWPYVKVTLNMDGNMDSYHNFKLRLGLCGKRLNST